jgi:low affinity Fe/Cu permease
LCTACDISGHKQFFAHSIILNYYLNEEKKKKFITINEKNKNKIKNKINKMKKKIRIKKKILEKSFYFLLFLFKKKKMYKFI